MCFHIFVVFFQDSLINNITSGKVIGVIIMMGLGFVLSLCSEADAFIAKGCMDNFGIAGVIAFLILATITIIVTINRARKSRRLE